jgi:hypothetical protein
MEKFLIKGFESLKGYKKIRLHEISNISLSEFHASWSYDRPDTCPLWKVEWIREKTN